MSQRVFYRTVKVDGLSLFYREAGPQEAAEHFGWSAHFAGLDCPASSTQTQQQLGWRASQAALIADIDRPSYFEIN